MKDIHEVLRLKQAKYAQLGKQIEALQQAADKLREVAPLLSDNEEDDTLVLAETEEDGRQPNAMAAKATSAQGGTTAKPRTTPRWP